MTTRGRRNLFAAILTFSFLVNFGRVAFASLVQPFMLTFQVQEATAGLVATAVWLGSALPRLPAGYLLTRIRRHQAILGMGVFLVLAAAFTAAAPTIGAVTLGALLIGLATGVFYIAANPLVSELYPRRVGWAVGLRGTASQVAAVVSPVLVAGALLAGSWRYAFGGLAVLSVAALVLFARAARNAELPTAGLDDKDFLGAARAQWRIVLAGIAIIGVLGFVWQGVFNFYVSYLVAAKGIDDGTARLLLTLVFGAGVPAFAISGRLADYVPYLTLLFVAIGTFVLSLVALVAVDGILAIAAVSLVMGYAVHSVFPVTDTYILATLPDDNRASAYAVYSAAMMLLQAPGSVAVGVFVESGVSYESVFGTYAVAMVAMLGLLVALRAGGRLPEGTQSG